MSFPFGISSQKSAECTAPNQTHCSYWDGSKLENNWNRTRLDHVWNGRKTSQQHEREIERTPQINIPAPFPILFVQTLPIVSCPIVLSNVPVADALVNLHGTFGKYVPRHDGLGH